MPTAYLRCLIKNTQPRLFFFFLTDIPGFQHNPDVYCSCQPTYLGLSVGWREEKLSILKILFIYFGCASLAAEHRL